MEQENTKVKAANAVEASIKSQSSEIEKQKSAQVKSKFAKKATASDTKKGKNALQVRKQIRKKKIRVLEGNIKTINNEQQDGKKLTSKVESDVKNATNKERCENNEEKTSESNKKQKKHKAEKKLDGPENSTKNNQEQDGKKLISREESQQKIATGKEFTEKNEEKNRESSKSSKKLRAAKKHVEPEKSSRNLNIKEKRNGMERSENDKREKLGGLIFMCSAKTKPDCFRYRVMGVSMSKKDIVLSIKPGLKIFLYDFDLRLMYGIYQASSSGGMKLEPEAFGGAFPVQVRFSVHSDCYPLSESTFKRAIKENYNERQKFKTELTVKQVRKLMDLFRPAALHSTALPIRSPPSSTIRDRDVYEGARESRRNSSREKFTRDPYANGDARGYPVSSHGRDQHIEYGAVASTHRDENTHSLYLTEKEYRAYGLQGERKNLAHPHQGHHIVPSMETLQSGHEREYVLRQPDPVHPHTVPLS
ncbi:Dev_Cell_Death domain-containing protein [Cephalotus follicularis]|uniref:Dev_Cell_Death domain-containing protein n=1 Tax=Cephalotus follicularis TaxID=3775 RepID=A0A1Q3B877_CEPFO|nr:Dev_Cell_Death domain-containing protein [Cephalotus follicularis]